MHKLIEDKKAFRLLSQLGYNYRRQLYDKINKELSPSRSVKTIKNWYLNPDIYIPKKHFDYYHNLMHQALREVLEEALEDLHNQKVVLEEYIPVIEQFLNGYDPN